ncbi:hypothetical protein [Mucilaginibacter sp.]|uniref:hypothetical protein n=1 Tax=Mucilaginibacter sp. TaxID=1882438 RepID=UPI0025DAE5F7|nr:hypothetical protein [Mucilaginibacter sp.]
MNLKEKLLYQQIHPFKLIVDFGTGFYTTYLMWQHQLCTFAILFLLPSIIATLILIRFADLEQLKKTRFGKYVEMHMTKKLEALRFSGQIMMWAAAWYHLPLPITIGFLTILLGWAMGLFSSTLS